MLNRPSPWCICKNCGVEFQAGWRVRGYSRASASQSRKGKQMVCSDKCAAERKEALRIKRTVCVMCGGPKNSYSSSTCSKGCSTLLRSKKAVGMTYNLCHYVAPNEYDYVNMLEILHRKGYVKAKDTKEKWTYSTTGFPCISWIDRMAREVVVSRKTRSRKKQQGHEDGVQLQAKEIGASAVPLKELRSSFKARVTGTEGAMEE